MVQLRHIVFGKAGKLGSLCREYHSEASIHSERDHTVGVIGVFVLYRRTLELSIVIALLTAFSKYGLSNDDCCREFQICLF